MAGKTQGPPSRGSRAPSQRKPAARPAAPASGRGAAPTKKPAAQKKPQPKKPNYAARRILALVLIAGVITAAVFGGIWLFGFVKTVLSDRLSPDPTVTVEPTDAPFTDQPTACDLNVTEWTFSVDAGEAGAKTNIPFTVTNNGEIPCLINSGASSLVLTVTSGDDRIWSNADCSNDDLQLLLGAGDSTERWPVWAGNRSAPGCTKVDAVPEAGTYRLQVTYNGIEIPEGDKTFELK
ncbi:hypothetical protein SAMN06298212_12121 [Ruaniaceae bacterium KH17]|nr:hypothetical protein SAMN06298212_12121 [Ruaniaceae bacterium KH17]